MNVKKITIIYIIILSFFLIPFNIFVLKNIYKNNLLNSNFLNLDPYIEIEILDFAKDKYNYYSIYHIEIKEVFLEIVLRNFSNIYHIEKQNETFRHYFKKLKNPAYNDFLKNLDISKIKKDYINRLNYYANRDYVENEIEFYRNKILFFKKELKNENSPELKVIANNEILMSLNKINKLKNISKKKFKAFENEIKIWINHQNTGNKLKFKTLKLKHSKYLKNLKPKEIIELRIKKVISITILNSIYILISILILRFLIHMNNYNFFIFKKKNIKK